MANENVRFKVTLTDAKSRIKRFPYLLGGAAKFRKQSAEAKLKYLQADKALESLSFNRFVGFNPAVPAKNEDFALSLNNPFAGEREPVLVKIEIRFPSGNIQTMDYLVPVKERQNREFSWSGFISAYAGELYVSARMYFSDGSAITDAKLTTVLSRNPDQLVITPREWLVSGRAGRVVYDFDDEEFHVRAYGTLTNGSSVSRTYRTCRVRITDGGESGTLIEEFSFSVGPHTVSAGGSLSLSIDTWYPKGNDVWDKFNKRWDLTVKFTFEADSDVNISDSAVYRPMSTVPINTIETTDFSGAQRTAKINAVAIATEILEDRDVTLYDPGWRILSSEDDKANYGFITIGWDDVNNWWSFDEAGDLYEEISGPDQEKMDVFIPLGFDYTSDVPADKRNVGGFSTEDGPYPKDDERRRSGCMVLLDENDEEFFGVAIAHEICHYLDLLHVDDSETDNLMHKNGGTTDHKLTWEQWDIIRQHGMMKWISYDV